MTDVNLGNFVWEDLDGDGIQDVGEPGIAGVTVKLLKNGSVVKTTTTHASGNYSFSGLSLGTYSVQVVPLNGYSFTSNDQGNDDSKDSDIDPTTGITKAYSFRSPTTNNTIDAGLFRKGSIGDRIWRDSNGNGIQDSGEPGISGITLKLFRDLNGNGAIDSNETTPVATKTTDTQGNYLFGDLAPGKYIVDVVSGVPSGAVLTGGTDPRAVTLTSGQSFLNADFGYRQGQANLEITRPLAYLDSSILTQRNGEVYLKPEIGQSFTQTITIKNTGNAPSTPGALVFTGINSPFVRLESVNGQTDGAAGDPIDQKIPVSISIAPGQEVTFNVVSSIVAGHGNDSPQQRTLSFQLQDVPGTSDYGNAQASATLYLTQTGFNKTAGSTVFSFNELGVSTLGVDINGDGNQDASQTATVARGIGTLTEGSGGQSPGTEHFLFFRDFAGDADATVSGRGGVLSVPFAGSLKLVWNQNPFVDITQFAANSGAAAFKNATPQVDSLLELVDAGLFNQVYATGQTAKDGSGRLSGTTPHGSLSQPAVGGNFNNTPTSSFEIVQFSGGDFQRFVNALNPQKTYRIEIQPAATLPLQWSDYDPNTQAKIAAIQLPTGVNTLKINAASQKDGLNLSQTAIYTVNGVNPTGAEIFGGNGKDTLWGTPGNDRISGGNGKDTFIFAINFGNDVITDFAGGETIDLTRLGITRSNLNSTLNTSNTGGNDVINQSDSPYASIVNSGSTSSLRLDLSSFASHKAGYSLTTSITFQGVTQLPFSAFA